MLVSLVAVLLLQTFCAAHNRPAIQHEPRVNTSYTRSSSLIYQFELGSDIESVVVSRSGELLVTRNDVPELWQIDPLIKEATLLSTFPGVTGLSGIAEIGPNEYVALGGNYSDPSTAAGSFVAWHVSVDQKRATISQITSIPQAWFLNDIEPLDQAKGLYLLSDSAQGLVYRLDVQKGEVVPVLDEPTMKPTAGFDIGVNGLAVHSNYLYYANSAQQILCRVEINTTTGQAKKGAEIIVETAVDDFIFDSWGDIYAAGNIDNTVKQISIDGRLEIIAGGLNSTEVAGDTSMAFGRTHKDTDILYVTTCGAHYAPVNGTFVEGAKVVALDVGGFARKHA